MFSKRRVTVAAVSAHFKMTKKIRHKFLYETLRKTLKVQTQETLILQWWEHVFKLKIKETTIECYKYKKGREKSNSNFIPNCLEQLTKEILNRNKSIDGYNLIKKPAAEDRKKTIDANQGQTR